MKDESRSHDNYSEGFQRLALYFGRLMPSRRPAYARGNEVPIRPLLSVFVSRTASLGKRRDVPGAHTVIPCGLADNACSRVCLVAASLDCAPLCLPLPSVRLSSLVCCTKRLE